MASKYFRRIKQPATGRLFAFNTPNSACGFTLLELMVVIVIVGIVLSFMTLSAGTDKRAEQLEREAQRIVALLQLASDDAVMRSEQLALRVGETDYEFMILDDDKWVPLEDDHALRAREMPAGIELRLELQDNPPPELTSEDSDQPQVFLLSSGEMTPFVLIVSAPETEQSYAVKASLLGRMELE
jgi:general secretion pathway protein H